MINRIKEFITLFKEAQGISGKLAIFIYGICFPVRILYKFLGIKFRHTLPYNIKIKNKDGIFYIGKGIFSAYVASSTYEQELRVFFNLKKGIFIDIGAHIGKYSIILSKQLKDKGKVIAIEPMEGNFNILKKSLYLNNIKNVISLKLACGNKENYSDLYIGDEKTGDGTHSLIKKTNNKVEIQKTQVRKLDNILNDLKIKRVDFIKIDVEGTETDVLKGATKTLEKSHPKIIFEAWDKSYLKRIKEILDKFNYKIKKINYENYFAY